MTSVINDKKIKRLASIGINVVDPFNEESVQPASIDLRLGNTYYSYDLKEYILGERIEDNKIQKQNFEKLLLKQGETAFVGIQEKITIPNNTIGIVFPRSSITRLGIQVITTYMNPGYSGFMPLTIANHSNFTVTLKPHYRVAQLVLFSLNSLPDSSYAEKEHSKYSEEKVESSKLHTDIEIQGMINDIFEESAPILHKMMISS